MGLIDPALWIFSYVPFDLQHERNVFTSAAGVGASPMIATPTPWPFRPAACRGAMPYAVRIWFGYRPLLELSALGNIVGTQPNAGVPVRVGVPPPATTAERARDALLPELSCTRIPATVSTLPLMPLGSLGMTPRFCCGITHMG